VKPSTLVELVGFACFVVGAWMLSAVAGVFTLGAALLFIGYALDDDQSLVAVRRAVDSVCRPIMARVRARSTTKG
jgi:hypothetical protein